MSEPYNKLYSVGDYLIIELFTGDVFEGDYCNSAENRIDLINTTQHNNPNTFGGIFSLYRSEISNINVLKSQLENIPTTAVVVEELVDNKRIKISEEEYNRLKDMYINYIYIEHADDLYYTVIEKLKNAESVGVVAIALENNQTSISLLAVSTWEEIYLFDMHHFKNDYFHPELKDIFESSYVCKVIHNSGQIYNILCKKYKVYTLNVFDTYVVDLVIERNKGTLKTVERGRSIAECLVYYLNFPSGILEKALNQKWTDRSEKKREYAAQLAAYLITLRDRLQEILRSEISGVIKNCNKYFSKLNDFEFAKQAGDEVSDGVKKLIPLLKRNTISSKDDIF